jgi:hypothetical protein
MSLRMAIETLASTRAQHKNPELLRFIRDENRNLAELLKLPGKTGRYIQERHWSSTGSGLGEECKK